MENCWISVDATHKEDVPPVSLHQQRCIQRSFPTAQFQWFAYSPKYKVWNDMYAMWLILNVRIYMITHVNMEHYRTLYEEKLPLYQHSRNSSWTKDYLFTSVHMWSFVSDHLSRPSPLSIRFWSCAGVAWFWMDHQRACRSYRL